MANRIKPLSEHVASQIASTKEIHSLKTAVLGLLENSLDANSSKIEITINFVRRSCKIEDNGHGIVPQEFESQGGLCQRHHTAKQDLVITGEAHSCEGTFLTSLATLSLLSVTSKVQGQASAHLLMHHGQILARNQTTPPTHELVAFPDYGTRVLADDLFGNLPVRAKRYALSADDNRVQDRLFDEIKQSVLAILLAWSRPCSVRLQDQQKRAVTFSAAHPNISHALTSRALGRLDRTVPKFSLHDKLPLLSQAGVATVLHKGKWIPVSASSSKYTLQGLICSAPAPSAKCQFISIGPIPFTSEGSQTILHQAINKLFSDSSFGMSSSAENVHPSARLSDIPQIEPGQKGIDKWPMFVINITPKQDHSTMRRTPDSTLDKLLRLITQVIRQWLELQGFQPARVRKTRSEKQFMPSASSQSIENHEDNHAKQRPAQSYTPPWTSIRSGQALSTRPLTARSRETSATETVSELGNHTEIHAHNAGGSACCQDVKTAEQPRLRESDLCDEGADEVCMPWQDPITKKDLLVNLRTGMTVDRFDRAQKGSATESQFTPIMFATQETHETLPGEVRSRSSVGLPQHLQTWRPPTFEAPLQPIPRSKSMSGMTDSHPTKLCNGSDGFIPTSQRLTRFGLRHARVIAQVDSKFVLCVLPAGQRSSQVVLIDQHAASERVLLEQLLAELCEPLDHPLAADVTNSCVPDQWPLLDKPIVFETTAQEAALFQQEAETFSRWGVVYDVSNVLPQMSASQVRQPAQHHRVSVRILPRIIAERCRSAPKVLVELMRGEIWASRTHNISKCGTNKASDSPWLTHIGDCPRGILDLVNSRACRSAIMFNDPLTVQECEELVKNLSTTTFPWICAHGRTSAVPIMELNTRRTNHVTDFSISGFEAGNNEAFSTAYTRWSSKA
ncbi:hypothetical protein AMS68_003006 [Peltaster fructicola]|uniref:MutL C-terminal dimerisation domain-containing protein n=1 Tax=Peltaster fructicola TaxID=286661 RepID=A0A6H0XS90_9PEZI|nr:hypothetical protein AMS68_003006 [Peltaster fructicola]